MTKLQSSLDVVMEMLRDLEEFERSGGKEAFRKQLRVSLGDICLNVGFAQLAEVVDDQVDRDPAFTGLAGRPYSPDNTRQAVAGCARASVTRIALVAVIPAVCRPIPHVAVHVEKSGIVCCRNSPFAPPAYVKMPL